MHKIETNRLLILALNLECLVLLQKDRSLLEKHLNLRFSGHQISGEAKIEVMEAMTFWMKGVKEHPETYEWYTAWEIILKDKNQSIGGIGFTGLPDENGSTLVGYHIDERFRNEGFASEALQAMIAWAIKNTKLKQLIADTPLENIASQRVLIKNGFVQESVCNNMTTWVLHIQKQSAIGKVFEN